MNVRLQLQSRKQNRQQDVKTFNLIIFIAVKIDSIKWILSAGQVDDMHIGKHAGSHCLYNRWNT